MGQQVKPQHNTPHPDHSLYIFLLHTRTDLDQPPPKLLPPTPCSRAGSQHRPQPSLHPLPPCLGKGGTGPPTKGHKSRGGGPAIPPLPQGTTGKENCVFPKLSYSFLLGLMHTHTHTEQPQLEGLLSLFACPHSSCGPQQPWSVPSCVSRTRNQAAPLWLLHSTSSSAHKAVLRRHHQGTARGQALGFCSKASCRHCS